MTDALKRHQPGASVLAFELMERHPDNAARVYKTQNARMGPAAKRSPFRAGSVPLRALMFAAAAGHAVSLDELVRALAAERKVVQIAMHHLFDREFVDRDLTGPVIRYQITHLGRLQSRENEERHIAK